MGPWCTLPHRSADRLPSRSTAVTRYRIHQSRSRPSPITSPHHRPRSFGFGSSFPALSNITSSSSLRTIRALPAYFPFHSPLPKLWFTDPPFLLYTRYARSFLLASIHHYLTAFPDVLGITSVVRIARFLLIHPYSSPSYTLLDTGLLHSTPRTDFVPRR